MEPSAALSIGLPLVIPGGSIDLSRDLVVRGDATFALTPLESKLLRFLAEQSGAVVPKDRLLQEVWGYSASVQSRAVDKSIYRLRQKLEKDEDSPQVLITVAGEGVCLKTGPGGGAAAARPLFEVPPRYDAWFGDTGALARVRQWVEVPGAWITLVGPGGAGKTRFAVEVATGVPEAVFLDLTAARGESEMLASWAQELGVPVSPDTEQRILAWLGSSERLIVLDNVEQLLPTIEVTFSRWRATLPRARWLVTSRRPVGVIGERLVEVPALSLEHARALFIDRQYGAGEAEEPGFDRLLERLEGLPLAIELAATRRKSVSIDEMLARWDEADRWLAQDRRSGPERHRGLAQTISWGFDLLSRSQQSALVQLTVFHDSFDLRLLEVFWGLTPDESLTTLEALLDHYLVRPTGPGMFRMHQVLKSALARRASPEDLQLAKDAHARAYRSCVRAVSRYHPRWGAARADLQMAVDRCLERGWYADAAALARVLGEVYWSRGPDVEGPKVLGRVREAIDAQAPEQLPDDIIYFEASFLFELGQTAATQERLQRLAPHSDFRILFEAQLLHAAGRARESLDLVRTIHSPTVGELRCACLWMELMCWSALGEYDRALWLSKELVDLARQLGETLLEGLGMTRAADSYLRRGEYDESEKWFRDAIQVFSAIRNLKAEGLAWDGLGVVFQRKGDSRGAVELHRKALELHRYSGAGIRTESVTRANLGGALHRLGDLSGARNEIEVAVASFRNMGRRSGLGRVLWNLARVYKDQGERQLALTALAEVCGELRAATEPDVVASAEEAQRRW